MRMISPNFSSIWLPRSPEPSPELQPSPAPAIGAAAPPTSFLPPVRWQPRWTLGLTQPGQVLLIFLFSAALALGTFALDGDVGINLADEGFLWYGSSAVLQGQVPLRDFQSYDPGRYYWVAGWSLLLGNGLLAMRAACALFQTVGVGFGLLALREAGFSWRRLGLVGVLVTFWMLERFKLYEQCTALMALYPAVRLIRRPDWHNALLAGIFVGLAAFMGRNHGVYCATAFGLLFVFLAWKHRDVKLLLKPASAWTGGVVLGYAPMLVMLAFVPGFAAAFLESLRGLARSGATNYTIPVPWPWTLQLGEDVSSIYAWALNAQGWCFVLLPLGLALAVLIAARLPASRIRENAALIAASALGVPYAHYAFSRADAPHLCHSFPLLVVALLALRSTALPSVHWRLIPVAAASVIGVLTTTGTLLYNPLLKVLPDDQTTARLNLDGDKFRVETPFGLFILKLREFARTRIQPGENLLIAPYSPTLYNLLHRHSPLWEIYFLWSPTVEKQRTMIRELEEKNVRWILIQDIGLDGRADRRLSATHPIFLNYIREHYARVADFQLPSRYFLLCRIDSDKTPLSKPQ